MTWRHRSATARRPHICNRYVLPISSRRFCRVSGGEMRRRASLATRVAERPPVPALRCVALALIAGIFASAALGGPEWLTAAVASMVAIAYALTQPLQVSSMLVLVAVVAFATAGHARFAAVEDAAPL